MAIRVGINGFGRIGRNLLRCSMADKEIDFVAVNDVTDTKTLAHLLKYDSVLGNLEEKVTAKENSIVVGGDELRVLSERDPGKLPWKDLGADIVVESTGLFTARPDAAKHLDAGAKKVLISAPAKKPDVTICLGVNTEMYDPAKHHVISNASCTTNCLAPVAKVLHSKFGIVRGYMTTIHSYTNDQKLLDLPHKDLRRARAAALSMIPTTTGAATAVGEVLPDLKGKLDGISIRVPTPNVSVVDLVVELSRKTTEQEINDAFKDAAATYLKGILDYTEEELVSIDFRKNPHSSIVDGPYTAVMDGNFVKILSWYDNEWGYSCRLRDLIKMVASKL
jgi:glyceraldehyde 3-phosphate dehydrogenase